MTCRQTLIRGPLVRAPPHQVLHANSAPIKTFRLAASNGGSDNIRLNQIATDFAKGRANWRFLLTLLILDIEFVCILVSAAVESGEDPDELVAVQVGVGGELTKVQEKYKDQIKEKLEQRAEELKKEREARAVKFQVWFVEQLHV